MFFLNIWMTLFFLIKVTWVYWGEIFHLWNWLQIVMVEMQNEILFYNITKFQHNKFFHGPLQFTVYLDVKIFSFSVHTIVMTVSE